MVDNLKRVHSDMGKMPKILSIIQLDGKQVHTMKPSAEILVGLVQLGFSVTIMTNEDSPYIQRFEEGGVRVIRFFPKSKFNRREIAFVREELIQGAYDVMYLVTNNCAITTGLQAARGLAVKVVLYRGYSGNLDWYNPISYTKHLHPRVDKIVCNGQNVEDYFHKQLFFKKSKTTAFVKGHALSWYSDVEPSDLSEFGVDDSGFVVTWVGHNRQRMKGLDYLIKATYLWPIDCNIHLLLVGADTKTSTNVALAESSPNHDRIHFIGSVPDPRGIVKSSDVFILPSVKGEAATRSVQEAMSMGVTPVISDIPGNKELIVNDESGLMFPVGDSKALAEAVIRLQADPILNKRLGEGAKERIRTVLNHKNTVNKMADLFEALPLHDVRERI